MHARKRDVPFNTVRMIKPELGSILTTGMFNLIFKDPKR